MGRLRKDDSCSDSSELETVPFKVGEETEIRSFVPGYRGAWFRCIIYEIRLKKEESQCLCQYLDFFNTIWHKAYEPGNIPRKRLMLRPKYPKIVDDLTGQSAQEPTLVINRRWEVGDFAEWFWEGAYWECQILEILNDDQVMVRVPAVPFGEGGIYVVMKKVLRPALSWSPVFGWQSRKRDPFASPHGTVHDLPRNILVETTETGALYERMRSLLKLVMKNGDSWPFREPVDGKLVPDYYDVIKDPIDLKTISMRVDSKLYLTLERFVADLRRMFTNARSFNSPNTVYIECADRLERFILRQLQ